MQENPILLSTAYLPPVQYISKFIKHEHIWLEAHEHFVKQTFRNRAVIMAANGPESLIIPTEKGRSQKQKITDLKISYDTNWQHIHWNSIVSAYNSTPFFEILEADFRPFFEKRYDYLFDFNREILDTIFGILEIDPTISLTNDFELIPEDCLNFREAIHPKQQKALPDPAFEAAHYTQVFDDKHGFTPNLSIIDLLFNCGSESYETILRSIPR
ncbi:WbqC family protein [Mangrovibacterium marinum]|uniref:WbqC-like protein n=1 Tax=Mangrovibacterium marinum TaxID=1639118 RepID=A0A2T5BYB2_9BACT|nr:WbqC family protein [Mangrovibacterium marinum]PTN06790.1 WbqC-like protein [Mangrovibacterium marinum]